MKKGIILIVSVLLVAFQNPGGYGIGDAAMDFKLKGVDDREWSLSDFPDAKGHIVIFTCNSCPYAVAYEDRIIALDKKYKPLGYPVIAINPSGESEQENLEAMKARAREKSFSFPYVSDADQKLYPVYGAVRTPHAFVLKKQDGKNIVKYIGAIDNNYENPEGVTDKYIEEAVDALLDGREVIRTRTVAIGCAIKPKK